jgi:DNA-binding transcriptional MerR regulator
MTIESICSGERGGLIAEPGRTDGNYRVHGEAPVQRMDFIRRCRSLDMALDEIGVLLRFKDPPRANFGDVNAALDAHLGQVTSQVHELRGLERRLRELRSPCHSIESGADCGILKRLGIVGLETATVRKPLKPRGSVFGRGDAVHGAGSTAEAVRKKRLEN